METRIILAVLTVLLAGCYKKNLGPRSDVTANGTEGYWKLTQYSVKGKSLPVTDAPSYLYLRAQVKTVVADSNYLSKSLYRIGTDYREFTYYDKLISQSSLVRAIPYDNDFNEKTQRDTFWYRIDDYSGFSVTLDVNSKTGQSSRLRIGNVMQSQSYKAELDSVGYEYIPVDKFN